MKNTLLITLMLILIIGGCEKEKVYIINDPIQSVAATIETEPVPSNDDAADDPCIWIHPTNPSLSTIIGTHKKEGAGLIVYDLDGNELQKVMDGRMNNVDIRYNFPLGGEKVALVVSTNRDLNTLSIYKIDPETRYLSSVSARELPVGLDDGVYGVCMYKSSISGKYFAFPNDKTGKIEQWELFDNGNGLVDGTLVRTLKVDTQPEGCVADDIHGILYVGEEDHALWRFNAEADAPTNKALVDSVGTHIYPDLEGLSMYYIGENTGYLLASSQGNNTYIVYERQIPNKYIGTFNIIDSEYTDGVMETDGIDITNFSLGPNFPKGMFVVQDGFNDNANQNFKCIPWDVIASKFDPILKVSTTWDPRKL